MTNKSRRSPKNDSPAPGHAEADQKKSLENIEHLYTMTEVAAIVGVSKRTIQRARHDGDLRWIKVAGRMVRIAPSAVREYLHRLHMVR